MLQKILDLVTTNGYLRSITKENVKYVKMGPTGLLLQDNLKTQWFNNVVINKELTVFPSEGDIQNTFDYARRVCLEKLPFGIAENLKREDIGPKYKEKHGKKIEDKLTNFKDFFEEEDKFILKSTIFVPSETSIQFFHQWQRQRRMWWRKVSCL